MKFSHNWLQTFFDDKLPEPDVISQKLTFHSSEVEEILTVGDDTVFDLKVLPDKSAWLLSHRGLARELAVILERPLSRDPLTGPIFYGEAIPDLDRKTSCRERVLMPV